MAEGIELGDNNMKCISIQQPWAWAIFHGKDVGRNCPGCERKGMIDIAKGRYWDEGIELVSGCSPCSPGCDHCWSAAMTYRFYDTKFKTEPEKSLMRVKDKNKFEFSGHVINHPDRLSRFNTRKPKVFSIWNDLFHEAVPFPFIREVIFAAEQGIHTLLLLTKRPQRMIDFYKWYADEINLSRCEEGYGETNDPLNILSNLWHGLTVCNQQEADEKIPIFLQVPGKKFLSIEPMLGEIDLKAYLHRGLFADPSEIGKFYDPVDAVILGGETGTGARPLHPDWVRSVRDQCAAAEVPFFFKGWGEWAYDRYAIAYGSQQVVWVASDGRFESADKNEMELWDESGSTLMARVGRNKAGRLLDGRTHDDLPWVKP